MTPDALLISTLVGGISPIFLAMVTKGSWSSQAKAVITMLVCLALGLVIAYAEGQLVVPHSQEQASLIVGDVLAVLVASQSIYHALKQAGLIDFLESSVNINRLLPERPTPAPIDPPQQPGAPG